MKKIFVSLVAIVCGFVMLGLNMTPVAAQTGGLGPWGDIEGYYTWQINDKGWTVYSQNGTYWIYDDYGHRTYLDANGNPISGGGTAPAPAPAPTVNNYTFYYTFTSPDGYNVYTDGFGNNWWFAQGGVPQRWTRGYPAGSYWKEGIGNYTYYYSYRSNDGLYVYRDDYNNYYWFGSDGTPHLVKKGSGGPSSVAPAPAPAANIDYSKTNVMEADGVRYTVYVGQSWVAPKTVSWTPEGMHLVGWDYAADTGYVRWKPGAAIKNTGSNLYLYPVFAY